MIYNDAFHSEWKDLHCQKHSSLNQKKSMQLEKVSLQRKILKCHSSLVLGHAEQMALRARLTYPFKSSDGIRKMYHKGGVFAWAVHTYKDKSSG